MKTKSNSTITKYSHNNNLDCLENITFYYLLICITYKANYFLVIHTGNNLYAVVMLIELFIFK